MHYHDGSSPRPMSYHWGKTINLHPCRGKRMWEEFIPNHNTDVFSSKKSNTHHTHHGLSMSCSQKVSKYERLTCKCDTVDRLERMRCLDWQVHTWDELRLWVSEWDRQTHCWIINSEGVVTWRLGLPTSRKSDLDRASYSCPSLTRIKRSSGDRTLGLLIVHSGENISYEMCWRWKLFLPRT